MRTALALALLLVGGCVVHTRGYVPPPAPPPPAEPLPPPPASPPPPAPQPPEARLLTEREAVRAASEFVRSRGVAVQRYRAKLDSHGNWQVQMRSDSSRDRARVIVDGRSGSILKAEIKDSES